MQSRLNNPDSCICCIRRTDGLAVGRPGKLAWYCRDCGSDLARKALYMDNRNMDAVEQRACLKVAQDCGSDVITIEPDELPAFIAYVVKSFADTMRKDMEEGGAPF
jgi:ribosomal protein L37AE/L43A